MARKGSRRADVVVAAPERARHAEALADLFCKTFGNYSEGIECLRERMRSDDFYDWRTSRIALAGDEVAGHFGVYRYSMRVGRARVLTAGIGGVATAVGLRRKGVMTRVATEAVRAARANGYDMSVLFGIRDLYHRFGYVSAWAETTHTAETADLPAGRPARRLVGFAERREDVERLYNREYALMTGTAVRPTHTTRKHEGWLWRDAGGRLLGYVMAFPEGPRFVCQEAAGDAEEGLRALAALARKSTCHEVLLRRMPWEHPMCVRLRRGRCRVEHWYDDRGGPMARVVNLASTFSAVREELELALSRSRMAGWSGLLVIEGDGEAAGLRLSRGKVKAVPAAATRHSVRAGPHVAQLVIGSCPPLDVVERGRMRMRGEARALVEAMFPERHPTLSGPDRY